MVIILLSAERRRSSFLPVYLQDYVLCFEDTHLGRNLQRQMCGCLLHRASVSLRVQTSSAIENARGGPDGAERCKRCVTLLLPGGAGGSKFTSS